MSDKSSNPMLSDEQAREAQEWAKQIHESQVFALLTVNPTKKKILSKQLKKLLKK